MNGYRFAVVQAAAGQLGALNTRVADYWLSALGTPDPYPREWCGAFNLWCLHEAELALDRHWLIGKGFLLVAPSLALTRSPQPGDTSYKGAPYQHHAIVERVDDDGTVHTIDGNQGPPLFIKRAQHRLGDSAHQYFSIASLIPAGGDP